MKKALSVLLALTLILGSFSATSASVSDTAGAYVDKVYAAATSPSTTKSAVTTTPSGTASGTAQSTSSAVQKTFFDIAGQNCEEAVGVLSNLKVVSGYSDGSYRPTAVVTRAEMASLIVKALGMDGYNGAKSLFADIKGHWAENYIAYANSIGIIAGRSDSVFDPDTTVSYDEAATMLVKALGYNDKALNGQWPTNYVAKAQELGILDDVQAGRAGANRGDCAVMLYQTLDQRIGKVNNGVFEAANVYKKGITDANAATGTMAPDTMMVRLGIVMLPEFIVRGNEDSLINLKDYQGACLTAYQNSDEDIIGISEVKSTFLTGKFREDREFKVNDVVYSIASGAYDKASVYQFEQGGTSPATGRDMASLGTSEEYTLAVEVSGKTIKKIYSVSHWTTKTIEATAAIANNIKSGKKINTTDKFELDDRDNIDGSEFVLLGVTTISAIKSGNVLTYAIDDSHYVRKLAVGTETVSGPVTKIYADYKKITINGKDYEMYDGSSFESVAKIGNTIKLILTYDGYVFKTEKSTASTKDSFGIVVNLQLGNNIKLGTNAHEPQVNLYTPSGNEKIFDLDVTKLVDNGYLTEEPISGDAGKVSYVTTGTANVGLAQYTVIRYELDANGKIDVLEAATPGAIKRVTKKKVTAQGALDGHAIASDATLFIADNITVNGDGTYILAEDYSVTTKARLLKKTITEAIYTLNDKEQINMMVVKADTASDDMYAVINDFYSDSSDAGYGLDLLMDGTAVTYHTKNNYASLIGPAGALKVVKLKADGTVDTLTDIVENSEKKITKLTGSGISFLVDNERLKISSTPGNLESENYDLFNKILDTSVTIYVWDDKKDEWAVGNTADLSDMLESDYDYLYIYELDSTDNPDTVTNVVLCKE